MNMNQTIELPTTFLSAPLLRLAACTVLAPFGVSAQSILTVDDSGGAQYTAIQPAIDAATAGDVVLVRAGDYAEFEIVGKGVDVLADEGASVRVVCTLGSMRTRISAVPAGQRATIRGMEFAPPLTTDDQVLLIDNSPGIVVIEDFSIDWPPPLPFTFWSLLSNEPVEVVNCDQVVFVNADVQGATGSQQGVGLEAGQIGLNAVNSSIFAHGSRFAAGGTQVGSGTGRTGALVTGGQLVLRDCSVEAAGGGFGGPFGNGGNGGPGLTISGATVQSFGSLLVGGIGGTAAFGSPGNPGPSFLNSGGTLNEVAADATQLRVTRVVRDDASATFDFQTEPASAVWLLLDLNNEVLAVPPLLGFLGVSTEPFVAFAGVTDATGALQIQAPTLELSIGFPVLRVISQGLTWSPTGGFGLSNPSMVTIVDSTF